MVYRRKNRSTDELREFIKSVVPVWNKQCVRCATVYAKFFKVCPECEFTEWLLEGEVDDVEAPRPKPSGKNQKPQYKPRPETIDNMRRKIQGEWVANGDPRAALGIDDWEVPRTVVKDTTDLD